MILDTGLIWLLSWKCILAAWGSCNSSVIHDFYAWYVCYTLCDSSRLCSL